MALPALTMIRLTAPLTRNRTDFRRLGNAHQISLSRQQCCVVCPTSDQLLTLLLLPHYRSHNPCGRLLDHNAARRQPPRCNGTCQLMASASITCDLDAVARFMTIYRRSPERSDMVHAPSDGHLESLYSGTASRSRVMLPSQ